ncbi:MAG: DUF58 domain-containing protein [Gemmatimonadaceae bacterium]|jgi:uncharacterized protein (DUF58 family)|nr:DUF58 domain-containing protein [Gemmatimonadota bacterium]
MPASVYGPLLDALRGVRWPARRAVAAGPAGTHRSTQRGTAGEFTEYRLYRQGDDPRTLDWKLLARSDRAFVRLSDDRAQLATWFVVDASASMAFPDEREGELSKWRLARRLTVGLAAVAHASSDPVGLLVAHGGGATRVPPRTRRGTVQELARVLDATPCGGAVALAPLVAQLPTAARMVIVSDALGDLEALRKVASAHAVAGALVEFIHVVAREELEPPADVHLARDPEQAALERVLDVRGRTAYRDAFAAFRRDVAQRWRAIGAGYTEVVTSVDPVRAVRAVVMGISVPATVEAR